MPARGAPGRASLLRVCRRRASLEGSHPHQRGLREAQGGDRRTSRPTKRREVAERIRVAREFGDIAENAEYDDAKNEQAMLEHRIATLEERLAAARVIDEEGDLEGRRLGRLARPAAGRRRRRRRSSTTSSARPRRTRPRTSSRTSRPSARRSSAARRARRSRCRPRAARSSSRSSRSQPPRSAPSAPRLLRPFSLRRSSEDGRSPPSRRPHIDSRIVTPKRFPDRDEVASVRADAEPLEPGESAATRGGSPAA